MRVSLVIPCFNEALNAARIGERLPPVLRDLGRVHQIEVVFVDDGSVDGTSEALRAALPRDLPVRILRHETNRGLGAALRTGFDAATGDVVVTTDSDNTYRFEDIPRLLAALTPDLDVVTASPYHPEGAVEGVTPGRLLLSRGCSALYRAATGTSLHTFTSLFRVYRRDVLRRIEIRSDGFVAVAEILVEALAHGFHVGELPMTLHSRAAGVSKMRVARTARAHLALLAAAVLKKAA